MVFRSLSVALGLATLLSACGGVTDPSTNKVETFNGTLRVAGSDAYAYTLSKNGEVEVTMTSVAPSPVNGSLGIALGQIQNSECILMPGYVASGIVNRKVQFGAVNKGTYCVVIYDPGVLTVAVAYTGTFSHP